MEIVIDFHALFWYVTNNPKLSHQARTLIEDAERVVVPSIVLMEILYILEKNRIAFRFVDFLTELKLRKYITYPLDLDIIAQTLSLTSELEMHDRIIVATAQLLHAPLLSKDREIILYYEETIWY